MEGSFKQGSFEQRWRAKLGSGPYLVSLSLLLAVNGVSANWVPPEGASTRLATKTSSRDTCGLRSSRHPADILTDCVTRRVLGACQRWVVAKYSALDSSEDPAAYKCRVVARQALSAAGAGCVAIGPCGPPRAWHAQKRHARRWPTVLCERRASHGSHLAAWPALRRARWHPLAGPARRAVLVHLAEFGRIGPRLPGFGPMAQDSKTE